MKIKYLIDTLLSPSINTIQWVDRYAGLVQTIYREEAAANGKTVVKKFPIGCDVTEKDCNNIGIFQDLAPNDKYKSVVYWKEVTPMQNKGKTSTGNRFERKFMGVARLVCWVNKRKLGLDACSSLAAAVVELENIITTKVKIPGGVFGGRQLWIEPKGQPKKDIKTIFGKYDYNELVNWYVYPFDYFAIDFVFTLDQCLKTDTVLTPLAAADCENQTP